MNESAGFAVFFFAARARGAGRRDQALPAGRPRRPARALPRHRHRRCFHRDDPARTMRPMVVAIELELMVPGNMVRMIVSAHSDNEFGFYDRNRPPVDAGARACVGIAPPMQMPSRRTPSAVAGPRNRELDRAHSRGRGVTRLVRSAQVDPDQVVVAAVGDPRVGIARRGPVHAAADQARSPPMATRSPAASAPTRGPKSPVTCAGAPRFSMPAAAYSRALSSPPALRGVAMRSTRGCSSSSRIASWWPSPSTGSLLRSPAITNRASAASPPQRPASSHSHRASCLRDVFAPQPNLVGVARAVAILGAVEGRRGRVRHQEMQRA
jgi:hypothetical protein